MDKHNNAVQQQKTDEALLDTLVSTLTQMQKDVKDPAELEHVLDKSKLDAEQGDPKAQYHLGLYHETEKQEATEAIRLFRLAAAQEYAEALFHLGNLYEMGLCGLEQNHAEAVRLYGRAVKQEFAPAIAHLKDLYERGLYGLNKSHKGYALAQHELGLVYMEAAQAQHYEEDPLPEAISKNKKWIDKCYNNAVELFRLSASQGYAPAQCSMGQLYGSSMGGGYTNQNDAGVASFYAPQSVRWYTLSAKQGYATAQYCLGRMHQLGQGKLKKDELQAVYWYQKAAEQNHPNAQLALGMMHHEGQGNLEKNDYHALRLLRLAEEGGAREARSYINFIEKQIKEQQLSAETKQDDSGAWVALIQQQQAYLDAKKQNAVTKQESPVCQAKESKRAEKRVKEKQKKVLEKEVPKEIKTTLPKTMPPKTLFYNTLRAKIENVSNMRANMLEMQKTRLGLQAIIIKRIGESTAKLAKILQKRQNNSRLPGLELNLQSLNDLKKHNETINEQAEILNNFLQLCQGLLGTLADMEYMQLEKRLATLSIFRWEVFLAVREALSGEMNDVKHAALQTGLLALGEEWHLSVTTHAEFSKQMGNLKTLSETIKIRVENHLAFTESTADATFLSDAKIAEIALKVVAINTEIAALQGGAQKVPLNLKEQQHKKKSFSSNTRNRNSENTLGVDALERQEQNMADGEQKEAFEQDNPVLPIVKKTSKNERIAAYKKSVAERKLFKLKLAQDCSRAVYLKITQMEIEAGIIPTVERKRQAEQQIIVEISPLLKMELENLQSVINSVTDAELTQEEIYALLGSLARVNDLVSEEYQDTAIVAVARRLRNAIFKEHIAVEGVVRKNNAHFLEMANSWMRFLEKIAEKVEIGFFMNAEAVLRKLGSESLSSVFYIGKTLDIVAKDDADFWDKIAENIDVAKSEGSIERMLSYGGTCGSGDETMSAAARNFYWAIMGSELVALHEAGKRGNREARRVLKRECFKPLLPYLPEFRDRGVFARHPSAILKEDCQALNMLLAFKSPREPVIAESRTRLNPKAVIFSPEGTLSRMILRVDFRKNCPENTHLPSLNERMHPTVDVH